MNKIQNFRQFQNYLKKSPEYEVIEKPSTSGKTKLNKFAKQHSMVIVVAGDKS